MNIYKVTLENRGGHTRKVSVPAPSQNDAERLAEMQHPGYGSTAARMVTE